VSSPFGSPLFIHSLHFRLAVSARMRAGISV
jgi:hypothetical protein